MAGKFRTDLLRDGNGAYLKYSAKAFLQEVARPDVELLYNCRTKAMFLTMANLVFFAWMHAGQTELAQNFARNYLFNPATNDWFYAILEEFGFLPQNNSLERVHLEAKGSRDFAGIINTGLSPTRMMNTELPKLVYNMSLNRVGVRQEVRMLCPGYCITQDVIDFAAEMVRHKDIRSYPRPGVTDSFLVNTEDYLGIAIDDIRVEQLQDSLCGLFDLPFQFRKVLYHRVAGLCHVSKAVTAKGEAYYKGTCLDYKQFGCCCHAVVIQYPDEVSDVSIRAKKKTFRKRASKGFAERVFKRRRLTEHEQKVSDFQKRMMKQQARFHRLLALKRDMVSKGILPASSITTNEDGEEICTQQGYVSKT